MDFLVKHLRADCFCPCGDFLRKPSLTISFIFADHVIQKTLNDLDGNYIAVVTAEKTVVRCMYYTSLKMLLLA